MYKVIVIYGALPDTEKFLDQYRSVHLPLVRGVPNVQRIEAATVTRQLMGRGEIGLITEIGFASAADRSAALKSDAWRAVAADQASWPAQPEMTVVLAEDGE
ncbi:MAG: Ethyl tert-butyl ether degradation protein EthD [Frankiales bacterium]|nr:Ethyl tert-butyl ether degradation protein EthD [Frankiales bacterium]